MDIRLKPGYTGVIPKSKLPTYYYDPNLEYSSSRSISSHQGGSGDLDSLSNTFSESNCLCGSFYDNNDDNNAAVSEDVELALNQFKLEHMDEFIVGKKIAEGRMSKVFKLAFKNEPNDFCFIFHLRKLSQGQPGGIDSFIAVSNKGAAPYIYDSGYLVNNQFQYLITDRLSRAVDFSEFNNTVNGLHMQTLLIKAVIRMADAGVVHGDENTEGNIMYCKSNDRLYFVDFNDKDWLGNETLLTKYNDDKPLTDTIKNQLWGDYSPSLDEIIKKWRVGNFLNIDNKKLIIIMTLFNIIIAKLEIYEENSEGVPILLKKYILYISKGNLSENDFDKLIKEYIE